MQKTLAVVGKALLVLGVLLASLSAGGSFSSRIADIAKGEGQYYIRRAVTPPTYPAPAVTGYPVSYADEATRN